MTKTKNRDKVVKIGMIVALVVLVLSFIFKPNVEAPPGMDVDAFANCLTEKGAVMYGTEWCGHCQNQKKMFGSSFQYIEFVDCDNEGQRCDAAGVRGYPTWVIGGESYPGEQSFNALSSATGCALV